MFIYNYKEDYLESSLPGKTQLTFSLTQTERKLRIFRVSVS